jgi:2-beta-glucuronyltransferase
MTASNRDAGKVLIFSEHDYRTARRANLQPIADALVKLGHDVTFISVRYSLLSTIKGDSREGIRANTPETCNGIECYLWRPIIHPFNPGRLLAPVTVPLYRLYPRLPNEFIDRAVREAASVIVESGLGAILLRRIRTLNAKTKLIYYASDDLGMIGAHPVVQLILEQSGKLVDHVCIASPRMADKFRWSADRLYFVPHGINPADFAGASASPYSERLNAVSVGPSLFDPGFFAAATPLFPDVHFHVIGCGVKLQPRENLHVYGDMPFRDTLGYIKNATFGVAPYRPAGGSDYICDTSMKLMQYDYVGIPAVCANFAVGDHANRFGYLPGDARSIQAAINAAIAAKDCVRPKRQFFTWDDVARRVLNPQLFSDTQPSPRSA